MAEFQIDRLVGDQVRFVRRAGRAVTVTMDITYWESLGKPVVINVEIGKVTVTDG